MSQFDTSLRVVIQTKANNFFLVVITVFVDSNSQGTDFDISFTQRFYSKYVVVLYALLLTKTYFHANRPLKIP